MVNYGNGKIYKLVNNVDDKIYVGSTTTILTKRLHQHKLKSKTCPERTCYKHLINIGWGNVEIILIENYECKSKEELHARERHFIDELKPELNKQLPGRTLAEWYQDNKETHKNNVKEYRDNNPEKVKQSKKQWATQEINCECGKKVSRECLTKHKKRKQHQNYLKSLEN